jgi:hypothetical protein
MHDALLAVLVASAVWCIESDLPLVMAFGIVIAIVVL